MSCNASCGVYSNYSPVKIPINGIKCDSYSFTLSGVIYANGQRYVGVNDGETESAAQFAYPPAVNVPKCCNSAF